MLATSCQDYDPWDGDVAKYEYRKQFMNVFGNIDPNHTWNTAEQRSMEFQINVPGTFNLRIFTTNPKNAETKSELLANYTNGGQGYESGDSYTISFDCPSGLRKVWADIQYVGSERHIIQQVEIDMQGYGKAVFGENGATRATITPNSTQLESGKDLIHKTGKKEIFTKQAYTGEGDSDAGGKGFIDIIPENKQNTSKEDVHTDFVYVSTGETYHLYPIYIYTGANVQIGIQYREDEEHDWSEEIPMMSTSASSTDRITRLFSGGGGSRTPISDTAPYSPSTPNGFNWHGATHYDGGQQSVAGGAKYATVYNDNDFVGTLCDEIELNLPKGYEFRFWVKQELAGRETFIRYSDRESNSDKIAYFGTFNNKHKHDGQNVLYLGVEDWNSGTQDINDIVFAFVGSIPTIVDEGGPLYLDAEYLIAYEDMGTNDFDFNDIVLSVQHVSGYDYANVNILACGGTLPVYLDFDDSGDTNNKVCSSQSDALSLFDGKELHEALSERPGSYKTPMNVSGEGLTVDRSNLTYVPKSCTINHVPISFSLVDKAQYFQLKVIQTPDNTGEGEKITKITTPAIGSETTTPQAFVVSYTDWAWPTENTLITTAYDTFSRWTAKQTSGDKWYNPVWSGINENSSSVDYATTLRPSYSFDICLRTRDDILEINPNDADVFVVEIPYSVFAEHQLANYSNLSMAFVVTNRQVDQEVTISVYKNKIPSDDGYNEGTHKICTPLRFNDTSTTSTTSSYGDADKQNVNVGTLSSGDVIKVVFDRGNGTGVSGSYRNCHLNSIWAARPDKDVKMLDYEDVVGRTEEENLHDESCSFNQDGNCSIEGHVVRKEFPGKLTNVNDQIEVAIANSSTTKPNFLVCNEAPIVHQRSIASMIENAQAIATMEDAAQKGARFILKVVKMDGNTPIVSIYNETKKLYLKKNGESAVWSNTCETTFKICRGTGGSRTSCIPGWDDDDMFRFQACDAYGNNITSYYFNANGPSFKTGNGEWSLWYMFEIINN